MRRKGIVGIIVAVVIGISIVIFSQFNDADISPETNNPLEEETVNYYETLSNSVNLIQGDSNSEVTILALLDYQCVECKGWYLNTYPEITEKLLDAGKANIKFVNSVDIGNNSLLASEAVYCADDQGKFPEYQKKLFLAQQEIDGTWIESSQLKTYAQEIELGMQEFSTCLDSNKYEKKTKNNLEETEKIGVKRIPVFIIINSEGKSHIIRGGVPFEVFETVVNSMNN